MGDQAAPTDRHIETARDLKGLHVQLTDRAAAPTCWWCFRPWPCPDRAWSDRTLQLAGLR